MCQLFIISLSIYFGKSKWTSQIYLWLVNQNWVGFLDLESSVKSCLKI